MAIMGVVPVHIAPEMLNRVVIQRVGGQLMDGQSLRVASKKPLGFGRGMVARPILNDMDPDLVTFVHRRDLIAPLLYLLAVGVSFVSLLVAKLFFAMVALLYILPNPLAYHHHG
jgi:hypothetical protein